MKRPQLKDDPEAIIGSIGAYLQKRAKDIFSNLMVTEATKPVDDILVAFINTLVKEQGAAVRRLLSVIGDRTVVELIRDDTRNVPNIRLVVSEAVSGSIDDTPIFDNGLSHLGVRVLKGTIQQQVYRGILDKKERTQPPEMWSSQGIIMPYEGPDMIGTFENGGVFGLKAGDLHQLHATAHPAITLQAYHPPLSRRNQFTIADDGLVKVAEETY